MAGIEAAIAAAKNFREEIHADIAAIEELNAALAALPDEKVVHVRVDTDGGAFTGDAAAGIDALTEKAREMVAAGLEGDTALRALVLGEQAAAGAAVEDAAAQDAARAAIEANTVSALDNAKAKYFLAMADRMAAKSAQDAAAAQGGGGRGGVRGWWGLGTQVPLFGGVAAIGAWHIALDAVLESAIALGSALTALTVGIATMVPAAQDIYTHLQAVQTVNSALGSSIAPLRGQFEALAEAMAPQTVEAFGGALNTVTQHGTVLATVAREVVTGIDDWIARLDLFMAHQGSSGKILQDGVAFLTQFREAVDNVGVALHNLISADPGTAHFLMDIVVGATRLLDIVTSLPSPILEAGLALHSFYVWGGLLATAATSVLGPLRAMSLALGGVKAESTAVNDLAAGSSGLPVLKATVADIGTGFATWGRNVRTAVADSSGLSRVGAGMGAAFSFVNPAALGIAALAAGVGYLTYQMMQSSQASQQFAASVNQAFANSSATQFLTQYPQLAAQGLAGLNQSLHESDRAFVPFHVALNATARDFADANFPGMFGNAGKAIGDFFTGMVHGQQAMNSAGNFSGALTTLDTGTKNLLHDTVGLIQQGHGVAQSFALMDLAGVRASDSFGLAMQKVQNLITGYRNMSVQGTVLSGAVDAVTFAAEQQSSKVQQLTQAYSAWFQTISGGETTFVSFAQGMLSLDSAAGLSKANMGGLTSASLAAQQQFESTASAAQGNFNALLTLASAANMGSQGTEMLTRAMKDYVALLAPAAKNNVAMQATLVGMAAEVNPNITSFQQLTAWLGNAKHPMQSLDSIQQQFAKHAQGLSQDVKNLASAIGEDLNGAMASAMLAATQSDKAFVDLAKSVLTTGMNSTQTRQDALLLAEGLTTTTGNVDAARNAFITFAEGSLHLTQKEAETLWKSTLPGLQGYINGMHGKGIDITANIAQALLGIAQVRAAIASLPTASVSPGSVAGIRGPGGMATGGRIPGYGGGDTVPAMLEPGEAVVPKHLVSAVAPFLGAHHVPGFAEGGVARPPHHVGHPRHHAPWNMSDVAALWAAEIWSQDLRRYGRHSPIPLQEMEAIWAGTHPGHGILPKTALAGLLGFDERGRMGGYHGEDLAYWKLAAQLAASRKSEQRQEHRMLGIIAADLRKGDLHGVAAEWVLLRALERRDAGQQFGIGGRMAYLAGEMGYSRGGLVRSYDSGGYLPVGLSMAYNGTGKPEPVGAGAGKPEVHVHLHGDLANDAIWDRMQVRTLEYNYLNQGQPTGIWQPGS